MAESITPPQPQRAKRRIGIVGYGKLGQFLADRVLDPERRDRFELAFVWNRTFAKVRDCPNPGIAAAALEDLAAFASTKPDLIVEVAHPAVLKQHGSAFLECCDLMAGSPTGFADAELEAALRSTANSNAAENGLYIPAGALWGVNDIQKMADRGSLKGLRITMKKAPDSLKPTGRLVELNEKAKGVQGETVLYDGPVRALCPLAPNNVNTMACAALAGHNLGFDGVQARLVADPRLEAHVILIEVTGPGEPPFTSNTERYNPAKKGAVTGNATYASFLSSLLKSANLGAGVHFV